MARIAHLLSGLAVGGKERAALRLARHGIETGGCHRLILFDTPFRSAEVDLPPDGVPTHFLARGRGLDLDFARRLRRLLDEEGVEIVHAHNDTALVYAALVQAGRRGARVVATFHTWPSHPSTGSRILARLAATQAAVVAVSDELAGRLVNSGWLGRCGVVWNGVEGGRFGPDGATEGWRARLGVGPDDVLVGHVARFDPIKRHVDLLDAARHLERQAPKVVLVMVGQGALLDVIRGQAAGLTNLRFVPRIEDMAPFLRSLDLIVLCSAHEAAPLALLEGMACGVPVVSTAVGGVPHLLGVGEEEPAGLPVPPFDPAALAAAITTLSCDPALRRRLAAAGLRRVAQFSFAAEWQAYQALYRGRALAHGMSRGSVA